MTNQEDRRLETTKQWSSLMKIKRITTATAGLLATAIALTTTGAASAAPKTIDFPAIPGAQVVADYNTPHDGQLHLVGTYSAYTPEEAKADLDAALASDSDTTTPPAPKTPTWKSYVKVHKAQAVKKCTRIIKDNKRFGFKVGKKAKSKCVQAELRRGFNKLTSQTPEPLPSASALAQFCFDEITWRKQYEIDIMNKDPKYITGSHRWTAAGIEAADRMAAFDEATAQCPWGGKVFVPFTSVSPKKLLSDETRKAYESAGVDFVVPQGVPNGAGDWVSANAPRAERVAWLRANYPGIDAGQLDLLAGISSQLRRSTHPDIVIGVAVALNVRGVPVATFEFLSVREYLQTASPWTDADSSLMSAIWTYEGEIPDGNWHGGIPDKGIFGYLLDESGAPLPWGDPFLLLR